MKAYITKYALSKGIIAVDGECNGGNVLHVSSGQGNFFWYQSSFFKGEFTLTLPEAEDQVKRMIKKRKESLQKQLKKLENKKIKVVSIASGKTVEVKK